MDIPCKTNQISYYLPESFIFWQTFLMAAVNSFSHTKYEGDLWDSLSLAESNLQADKCCFEHIKPMQS